MKKINLKQFTMLLILAVGSSSLYSKSVNFSNDAGAIVYVQVMKGTATSGTQYVIQYINSNPLPLTSVDIPTATKSVSFAVCVGATSNPPISIPFNSNAASYQIHNDSISGPSCILLDSAGNTITP